MKFAMFGAGGTGGVLGGYLALAGHDVTLIARGRHLEALQKDGLTIETAHRGTLHIKNVKAQTAEAYDETPDVLFVCCKYYALSDAIAFAKRAVSPDTLIIPILNVFGTGEVMQKDLPGLTVLDGCIYIFGNQLLPGAKNGGDCTRYRLFSGAAVIRAGCIACQTLHSCSKQRSDDPRTIN